MTDLTTALEAVYVEPPIDDEEAKARFVVDDDTKATWAARKVARYRAEVESAEAQARAERERIDGWLADATAGARSRVEWFESLLVGYAAMLHDADPQAPKTHKFLGGEVGRRKQPDRVIVDDDVAFVAWAVESGRTDLLTIKPSVSAIKGHVGRGVERADAALVDGDSGEIIPGVEYVDGDERYFGKAVG